MNKRQAAIASIIGLAVFGSAIFALLNQKNSAKEASTPSVSVGVVKHMPLSASIFSTGRVVAADDRTVFSELAAGKVAEVLVKEGQSVKSGDVLLRLNTSDLDDQIKAATISLNIAKANLSQLQNAGKINFDLSLSTAEKAVKDAEKAYNDTLALYNGGAASLAEKDAAYKALDRAKTELVSAQRNYNNYGKDGQIQVAKLNVDAAQNSLNQLIKNKAKADIKAPIDGSVYKINVKLGDSVSPAAPVALISATNNLLVETNISEYDVDLVSLGQAAILKSDGFDDVYNGKVTYIAPVAESVLNGQSTETVVKVKIAIDQGETKFKPNFSANVEIKTATLDNALTIPYEAIYTTKEGEKVVFVVNDKVLSRKVIKTGVEGDLVLEVLGNVLKEGDQVVLNPTETLVDGMTVKVTEQAGGSQ